VTVRVETTAGCPRTSAVLFALEEMEAPSALAVRPDGWFAERHGAAGPLLADGDLELLGPDTIVRHLARTRGRLLPGDARGLALVDRWMEVMSGTLRPALFRLRSAHTDETRTMVARCLAHLGRALEDRDFLVGDALTAADCPSVMLLPLRDQPAIPLPPNFAAYLDRLAARPSWARVASRLAEVRP
jgi:glutathione S-transferase